MSQVHTANKRTAGVRTSTGPERGRAKRRAGSSDPVDERLQRVADLALGSRTLSDETRLMILDHVRIEQRRRASHPRSRNANRDRGNGETDQSDKTTDAADTHLTSVARCERLERSLEGIRRAYGAVVRLAKSVANRTGRDPAD